MRCDKKCKHCEGWEDREGFAYTSYGVKRELPVCLRIELYKNALKAMVGKNDE